MKLINILIFVTALVSLSGCENVPQSNIEASSEPIVFTYAYPNKTKDQLFSATKSWIAETFVSAKSVIDDADRDSGRIILKGTVKRACSQGFDCFAHGRESFSFTLRIDTKDGRFRLTFLNSTVSFTSDTYGYVEHALNTQEEIDTARAQFEDLSFSLKRYIVRESEASSNW